MKSTARLCAICFKSTTAFNYGVFACNACKLFFLRASKSKSTRATRRCGLGNNQCFTASPPNFDCKHCRFQKCIESGMRCNSLSVTLKPEKFDELTLLIDNLLYLDLDRNKVLINYQCITDVTLEQVISKPINFVKKPETASFDTYEWCFMEHLTTIEFMKKFDFVKELGEKDARCFIRESFFRCVIFATATRSFSWKMDGMGFPNGVDVVPDEWKDAVNYAPRFLARTRSRLIGRFIELKATKEELLLLGTILLCNPGIPSLSKSAKNTIASFRNKYSSALFQYCLLNYQQAGPSRFTDILSLSHVIESTFKDLCTCSTMIMMCKPEIVLKSFFVDLINSL